MLKHAKKIKEGKIKDAPVQIDKTKSKENLLTQKKEKLVPTGKEEPHIIRPDELSLKEMLVNKFKPIIEKQLQTKIEVKDFSARGDNFVSHILVQGHELELTLDSSGKIVDYKRLDE